DVLVPAGYIALQGCRHGHDGKCRRGGWRAAAAKEEPRKRNPNDEQQYPARPANSAAKRPRALAFVEQSQLVHFDRSQVVHRMVPIPARPVSQLSQGKRGRVRKRVLPTDSRRSSCDNRNKGGSQK